MNKILALGLLLCSCTFVHAAPAATSIPASADPDHIYQFFVQSEASKDRTGLGFYLWIPPHTPKIRAVMVGINNALPINILQSPPVRAVCRQHGIAQILFTPWAKDIGDVMMKELTFDVTDPERTAVYDAYLKQLAEVSGHPELVAAPIVPLGHSAFCGFPFEAAIRKPEQCLGTIPIKAGLPDVYNFFWPGGKAMHPNPDMASAQRAHFVCDLGQPGNGELESVSARLWDVFEQLPPRSRRQSGHDLRAAQRAFQFVLGNDERAFRHVAAQLSVRRRLARCDCHRAPAGKSWRADEEPHAARRLADESENSRDGRAAEGLPDARAVSRIQRPSQRGVVVSE